MVHKAFRVHLLNSAGMQRAHDLAQAFSDLVEIINGLAPSESREKSIAMTKLEEACFFAKKAMASDPNNQQGDCTITLKDGNC